MDCFKMVLTFSILSIVLSTGCTKQRERDNAPAGNHDGPAAPNSSPDSDGDGIPDDEDRCPNDANNLDSDGDGVCDSTDACPEDAEETIDSDGDGVCDGVDDCPQSDQGYADTNGDGVCDGNDDSDGDGISDKEERTYGEDCAVSNPSLADTDSDGILDNEDPYPRDPWPEFILYRNDLGTIDMLLSNRDGTFEPPFTVGDLFGGSDNVEYRYIRFAISDFDDDGKMDFLALGDRGDEDDGQGLDVWWFWRTKADELQQRLVGRTARSPFSSIADFNGDDVVDLVAAQTVRPNFIESVVLHFYSNQRNIDTASCFATEDPLNPQGCAFISSQAVDLTDWTVGQWSFRQSRDAVDVTGDGHRDLAILRISSGGNDADVPITILSGNGDGTFEPPSGELFRHNDGSCGASPANSLLFGDFDNDQVGDVITGLDDDGDAGSAWFYPGLLTEGVYEIEVSGCVEAFDVNPSAESGAENPGVSSSAHNFDFDFDGNQDVIVGYRYLDPWTGPSKTVLFLGLGNGSFADPVLVRDFPESNYGNEFAVPKRVCARFPMEVAP